LATLVDGADVKLSVGRWDPVAESQQGVLAFWSYLELWGFAAVSKS